MYPQTHFFITLIFASILKSIFPFTITDLLIIFLAAILIDIDHWLVYVGNVIISEHPKNLKGFFDVFKKKDFSIMKSYKWFVAFEKSKKKPVFLFVFHTIESFAVLILLSTKYYLFQLILIGCSFHVLLDLIDSVIRKGYLKEPSIILAVFKSRN